MKIGNAIVLVTGANRGIGLAFTRGAARARRAQGLCRRPRSGQRHAARRRADPARRHAARRGRRGRGPRRRRHARDQQRRHRPAGGFLAADSEAVARRQLETNFFGVLRVSQAFAPVLSPHGGGGVLNVLSIASWINPRRAGRLCGQQVGRLVADQRPAPRAGGAGHAGAGAAHGLRRHRPRARGSTCPKTSPEDIVERALDGLEAGLDEVLADERTRLVKQGLDGATAELPAAARLTGFRSTVRQLRGVQRAHGLDRVGLVRALVGSVALHAREAQRQAAGVLRARLQVVERDLDHQLGPHVHGVGVARASRARAARASARRAARRSCP